MFILILLLFFVCVCEGRHVLVVFPVPERSHDVLAGSLINTLLESDYEVTYVTLYPKEPRENLKYVDVSSVLEKKQDEEHTSDAEDISAPQYLPPRGTRFAQRLLQHPDMQELMKNTSMVFDAVLAEWFYTGLLAPLAALFNCPLIWYTPTGISRQSLRLVASTPALDVPPSSLADRVHHMWSQMYFKIWNYLHIIKKEIPAYERTYRDAFKVRSRFLVDYESVVTNGSLLLVNSQPVLGAAVSLPGNVKYIGGHHISEEVLLLPKDLKLIMDSSAGGVMYVNMEANLINSDVRDQITRELKVVFSDLEQTVIWKHDDILLNLPRNVYTLKNPPQGGILSHANIIAFINHGDMSSILEATHHGVPLISLPLMEDQVANVNMVVNRGCGVKMDTKNLTSHVKKSVEAILNNSRYRINAKKVNSIFRHRLASPQKEFMHYVDTVVVTQGAAFLRSPALQTSVLERYNVDVIFLVFMIFWFLTKVAKVVRVHLNTDEDHEKKD